MFAHFIPILILSQLQAHKGEVASTELISKSSKPCPNSQTPISHYRGHACHHIMPGGGCPGCGHHFCFVCLHDSGTEWQCCPNKCPMYCNSRCDCVLCPDCKPDQPCLQDGTPACDGCLNCDPNHEEDEDEDEDDGSYFGTDGDY